MSLTINQASSLLGVHKDTLRRWEKKGILTPIRKGKRNDREYSFSIISKLKNTLLIQKSIESKQWNIELHQKIESYTKDVVEFLKEIVDIPSVNGVNNERDVVDCIYNKALELELPAKIMGKDMNRPNIFVGKGFDSEKNFLFVAHLDTVDVGNRAEWSRDPFKATLIKNFLYGRGTADCKAGIALSIYTLKILNDLGYGKVAKFVGGSDEEAGAQSDIGIIDLIKHGLKASSAIYTYPGYKKIAIGSRGLIRLVVKCKGEQVHTGLKGWTLSEKGLNAIDGMRRFLDEVEDIELGFKNDAFDDLTSKITVTKFNAGVGESIVPPFAEVLIDIRLMPDFDSVGFLTKIKKIARSLEKQYGYKFSIYVKNNGPAWVIDQRLSIVKILQDLTKEVFGIEPGVKGRGPFNEGGFLSDSGIPTIGGYGINGFNVHGIDEYVDVTDIPKVLEVYVKTALLMYNKKNAPVAQLDRATQS